MYLTNINIYICIIIPPFKTLHALKHSQTMDQVQVDLFRASFDGDPIGNWVRL